ncbi:MAG: amidohydrolase [Candidatus Lernaella stagnicola]|nr:amidohydrolase [Candidatus Lernaella stagnicola]
MNFKAMVEQRFPQTVAWRRHFHQHPETSWDEHETSDFLAARLSEMGLAPRRVSETGLLADIVGGKPGGTVAMRADIDALPIHEQTGVPYQSEKPGKMHACGHDVHAAMLLAAAAGFVEHRDELPGTVRLIFQPAEETPPPEADQRDETGSVAMVRGGAMKGVDRVVGLHIFSDVPLGVIGLVPGPILAGSLTFDIAVTGQGGHAGMPVGTVDALAVAAHAVVALRSAASLGADPNEPLILHVGRLWAGDARTAVAAEANMEGTIRFVNPEALDEIRERVTRTVGGVARAFGAAADITFGEHVNHPVVNDPDTVAALAPLCREIVGEQQVVSGKPGMASEDFWAYLHEAPGAFVLIGGGNPAKGITAGHHSPFFNIDEDGMKTGLEFWLRLGFAGLF